MRLKELRQEKGLNQDAIGSLLNISRASYTNIENGKRDPDTKTLCILSEFYNVSVDYILGITTVREKQLQTPICANSISENVPSAAIAAEQQSFRSQELSSSEQTLISDFRSLSKQGKEYILQTMDMAVKIYSENAGVSDLEAINS